MITEQAAQINAQLQQSQKVDPSQDGVQRQMALELRHQELLKKQKVLQEQYSRLQEMSKASGIIQDNGPDDPVSGYEDEGPPEGHNSHRNSTITNKIYETEIL